MRREVLQNAIAAWQAWLLRIACGSYDDARAHTATKTQGSFSIRRRSPELTGFPGTCPGPHTVQYGMHQDTLHYTFRPTRGILHKSARRRQLGA